MAVDPIPKGYHAVTPYLAVKGASAVLDFVQQVFGAEEMFRMELPDGRIGHAEVRIGDSVVMVGDPTAGEGGDEMTAMLHVYVEDVDATFRKAIEAGGTSVREPETQFYGDRTGGVRDAAGNLWWIATHVEDVDPEEMDRRAEEWRAKQSS